MIDVDVIEGKRVEVEGISVSVGEANKGGVSLGTGDGFSLLPQALTKRKTNKIHRTALGCLKDFVLTCDDNQFPLNIGAFTLRV